MEATKVRISYKNKTKFYAELRSEVLGILEDEWLINLANFCALLHQHLPELNWVGFYLRKKDQLILGPFQGLPACSRIAFGKGVCGTAAQKKETLRIADVDQFSGHIVCDGASRSEIVIPLILKGEVIGVLDIDAPITDRFDAEDQKSLEDLVSLLMTKTQWTAFQFEDFK